MASRSPLPPLAPGYPKLADFMSRHHHDIMTRSFLPLFLERRSHLQHDIEVLELELKHIKRQGIVDDYTVNYEKLNASKDAVGERHKILEAEINNRLDAYYDVLMKITQLTKLRRPSREDMGNLQWALDDPDHIASALRGVESGIYGSTKNPDGYADDLVMLVARPQDELFFGFLLRNVLRKVYTALPEKYRQPHPLKGIPGIDREIWRCRVQLGLVPIVAWALPALLTLCVRLASSSTYRYVIVNIFIIMFTLCHVGFTSPSNRDLFTPVTTFSAIGAAFLVLNVSGSGCAC